MTTDNTNDGDNKVPDNTGAGADWFKGAQPELLTHMQTHGWDKKPVNEAALAAVQAHYNASKLIGADPNQIVKLPKTDTDPAWDGVYEKLGVPKDVSAYKFEGLKFADGTVPDKAVTDWLAAQALGLKLTPNRAQQFAQSTLKYFDDAEIAEKAEVTAKIGTEREALAKQWGGIDSPTWEANMFVAKKAATALGVPAEVIDTMQKMDGLGYAKVMELFSKIGNEMGEAKFIRNQGDPNKSVLSLDQAKARKAELMKDTAWVARYQASGKDEIAEMTALNVIIAASLGKGG